MEQDRLPFVSKSAIEVFERDKKRRELEGRSLTSYVSERLALENRNLNKAISRYFKTYKPNRSLSEEHAFRLGALMVYELLQRQLEVDCLDEQCSFY